MKKLSDQQMSFIMENFFNFHDDKYPGRKAIAFSLLQTGQCTVAGTDCIWKGGIGNFISTKPAENAVECSLYTFHMDEFLGSSWFREAQDRYLAELSLKMTRLGKEYDEIIKI